MKVKCIFFTIVLITIFTSSLLADNSWSEGADINNDGTVDFKDFAIVSVHWLENAPNEPNDPNEPNEPNDIVWIYIDDPGVQGHEGFTGYMSKYETTNAQYCQFLNAAYNDGLIMVYDDGVYAIDDSNYSEIYCELYPTAFFSQIVFAEELFTVRTRDGYSMDRHPVVKVSWYGATAFCDYYGYYLPTEWQWQAVADYNESYNYGCGTEIDPNKANYYLDNDEYCNPLGLTYSPYTSPVDYYPSYGYGLNDMAGNVWEWTSTNYIDKYYILKGGSWNHTEDQCTVSYQKINSQHINFSYIGFRPCR